MSTGAATRPPGRLELAFLVALLALHALALREYFVPNLGSPDANSYHVSARMVERHGRIHQLPKENFEFVGGMWLESDDGALYPKYPPLYPVLAGLVMRLFGDPSGLLVNPVCAWLAVLATYWLCRAWMPGWAAVVAAWCVATSPIVNSFALDQIAHAPSILSLTLGFALLFHAMPRRARARTLMLFGSGLLIGFAGGVRYTNVLLAGPPLVWFLFRCGKSRPADALPWLAGLALPFAFVASYHWVAFGSPLRTAYSLTDEQTAFSLAHFFAHAPMYARGVVTHLAGPLSILSALGLVGQWRRDWRKGVFFASWLAPLSVLYACYYFAPVGHVLSYIRFLLPLLAPLVLLALLLTVDAMARLHGAARAIAVAMLVLVQGGWGVYWSLRHMEVRYSVNDMNLRKLTFVREHVPPGSVVFGTFWLLDGLDYEQDLKLYMHDLLDQDRLRTAVERFMAKESLQPRGFEYMKAQLVDVDEATYLRRVRALIDVPLAEGREVYLIGAPAELDVLTASHRDAYDIEEVAVLPSEPPRHRLLPRPRGGKSGWGALAVRRIR